MSIPKRDALRIIEDLEILMSPPWPSGKVKKLRGQEYWEIRTGDFRTIFFPKKDKVFVLRIVNRQDLLEAIGRVDVAALRQWLAGRKGE